MPYVGHADRNKTRAPPPPDLDSPSRGDSETASVATDFSEILSSANEASLEDIVKDLLDDMQEKRTSTRLKALKKVLKILQTKFLPEIFDSCLITLQSCVSNGLRSKDTKEAVLSCQLLGLLCITFGQENTPSLFTSYRKSLETIGSDRSKNSVVRGSALRTLAMITFLGCDDAQALEQIMALNQSMFKARDSAVSEAATSSWGLLASVILKSTKQSNLMSKYIEKTAPLLLDTLDCKDAETKQNAGRALALISEACARLEGKLEEKDAEVVGEMMDDIIDKLEDLATTTNKSQNRKEKARQRASFREFLASVRDGEEAHESFTIDSNEVEIDGLAKCVQFGELRRWIGVGFQTHIRDNPLISDMFGFVLESLSQGEAREAREDKIYFAKIHSRAKKEKYQKRRIKKTQALVRTDEDVEY
eukprot:jgi/Bigna1/89867/estExt_fgenesh1_pg.C_570020